ncbi:MAG: prepilin-type N-terminal cleavage/methylation domain-containing protein [Phycisphaerales bacterium]|jgi:prepilin-type N-terminal cleavage/methylation domain-containing protein|nr:prepilin-type N-terminal cleavage/methylation domain-containing protein [Phycisphaerales bacterium]
MDRRKSRIDVQKVTNFGSKTPRSAYPNHMQKYSYKQYCRGGFTLIELMVVVGILIILASILIPTVSTAFRAARSKKDLTQQRGIYQGMMLHATGNASKFPMPSSIVDEKNPDPMLNTTSNLMSWMVMQRFFDFTYTVSPVETNPNIRVIQAEDGEFASDSFPYNYDMYDGSQYHWDPDFNADYTEGPAHSSYAHQALVGQRPRLKWHSGSTATDIIICNRGPELVVSPAELSVVDQYPDSYRTSFTFDFHGPLEQWEGAAVLGDGSATMLPSYVNNNITYVPLDGSNLRPDILFYPEFGDVDEANPMASGDNWIIVTSNITDTFSENETLAIWD